MQNVKLVPQIHVRSSIRSGAAGGGNVNGVWYPDMSGVCNGVMPNPPSPNPPSPSPSGGGYVNGVWYPDMSGVC
jgi:hypothetical protein